MIDWLAHHLEAVVALWVFLIGCVWLWFWAAAKLEEMSNDD